jgi:hypothetical protein
MLQIKEWCWQNNKRLNALPTFSGDGAGSPSIKNTSSI